MPLPEFKTGREGAVHGMICKPEDLPVNQLIRNDGVR
jgi:hypothetical protein